MSVLDFSCVPTGLSCEDFFFLLVTSVLCLKVFCWGSKLLKTKILNLPHLGSEMSIKNDIK